MRILGSLILMALVLLADFRVYLKQNPIIKGEPAQIVMDASGSDIVLPKVKKIGPYPIANMAQSESVIEQNGELVVKKSQILTFYPESNITIPSFTATIDGKKIQSQPLELVVLPGSNQKDVSFTLKLNKKEAYVGEPIIAELILKIRRNLGIVDYSFIPPKFENFWVKQLKSGSDYLEEHGIFLIKRLKFLLLPQKPGVLKISPAIFKYAISSQTTDSFGFSISAPVWKSVASNSASVIVHPLPQKVDLVGDFTIDMKVDKKEVQVNEPVNLTITIEGYGNLENLDRIPLKIEGVTVYEDKPSLKETIQNGRLHAKFEQHFSIIADKDYDTPALRIPYFSLKEHKIRELGTKPVHIHVKGSKSVAGVGNEHLSSFKSKEVAKARTSLFGQNFLFGFGMGVLATLLLGGLVWLIKKSSLPKYRGKKELLNRLLPYVGEDKDAAALAQALYEEIYEGKRHRIGSKKIKELLRRLES